ncbi:MAG: exopolysaccharide Pel transporter PelG [Candidatus Cloacimonetes bacterium]|nr:exopolysaccharide Pel transporter PelG [Candidatus Cloacimonadota bacterium]
MAGIGFELKKLFHEEGADHSLGAIFKSMMVTSGPWIISIVTFTAFRIILSPIMPEKEFMLLMCIIVYGFVFSMILSSPWITMVIRHISDLVYLDRNEELISCFLAAVLIIGIQAHVTVLLFVNYAPYLKDNHGTLSYFFTALNILWLTMVIVGAMKDFNRVVVSYLAGMLISILLMFFYAGSNIFLAIDCFTAGLCFTIFVLLERFFKEFGFEMKLNFKWLFRIDLIPLFVSGLLANLAVWIDKLMYWSMSNKAVEVAPKFYLFPDYDLVIFLSSLTMIPAAAFFTVFVETTFSDAQQDYLGAIEKGADLEQIDEHAGKLLLAYLKCLLNLFFFHSTISVVYIFVLTFTFDFTGFGIVAVPLLKISILNMVLQNMYQAMIVFLYYFDYQKEVVIISAITFIISTVATYYMMNLPFEATGYSFFIAMVVGGAMCFLTGAYKIQRINYYTFSNNDL